MKYKFKILNGKDGTQLEKEGMSYKKILKSLVEPDPKWSGAIYYTNKKGKYVCHSIQNGRKI